MSRRHPFQKICYPSRRQNSSENLTVLIAASGSSIFSLDLESGGLLARWPSQDDDQEEQLEAITGEVPDRNDGQEQLDAIKGEELNGSAGQEGQLDVMKREEPQVNDDQEPPSKRRKLTSEDHELNTRRSSDESIEIVAQREKGQRRKQKVVDTKLPNVSHMLATSDGRYVVALTVENKAVNVIEIEKRRLKTLSERCMPKRLCALSLSPDETTILVGDKFGDVYSLPLLVKQASRSVGCAAVKREQSEAFKPSASELTVHSKSNLEALRQQRAQPKVKPKKETPTFEHQLLLGHVSLLTDLAITNITTDVSTTRQFILTSDRDEHIRISRGLGQTHIIEGYCFGHKEFVSKLCVLPSRPDLLVAGSGEPSLKLYHWPSQRLIHDAFQLQSVKEGIRQIVYRSGRLPDPFHYSDFAVSGIWPVNSPVDSSEESPGIILVAIEGLPGLLSLIVRDYGYLHHHTICTPYNVLDVTVLPSSSSPEIIITGDTVHVPSTTHTYRDMDTTAQPGPFASWSLEPALAGILTPEWRPSPLAAALNKHHLSLDVPLVEPELSDNKVHKGGQKVYSRLGEFLYGLQNLRKRRDQDAVKDEDGEGAEGAVEEEE